MPRFPLFISPRRTCSPCRYRLPTAEQCCYSRVLRAITYSHTHITTRRRSVVVARLIDDRGDMPCGQPLGARLVSLLTTHSETSCHVHSESAHQAESNRRKSGHDHSAGTCGGLWLGGSLAHATNGASLDSAPCTTEAAVCFASASRSSSSTSTPSRRSAPRTGASRSRCWCAASHHCASVCTDPSTHLPLGMHAVVVMLCRAYLDPSRVLHIRTCSSRRLTRTSARWQRHSMRPWRACTYQY